MDMIGKSVYVDFGDSVIDGGELFGTVIAQDGDKVTIEETDTGRNVVVDPTEVVDFEVIA